MLSNTRSTLAIAVAATILGASPALAMPAIDGDLRGENAVAQSQTRGDDVVTHAVTSRDLRGEHAIGVSDNVTPPADDQRSPDAREPVGGEPGAQPVVVELTKPDGGDFDWTSAIIGMAAGMALAALAAAGVAGSRRRPTTV